MSFKFLLTTIVNIYPIASLRQFFLGFDFILSKTNYLFYNRDFYAIRILLETNFLIGKTIHTYIFLYRDIYILL